MVSFAVVMLFSYLSAQVIFLLDDPNYFNVPESKIGYVSGLLIFVSLPFAIIGTAFVGFLYDILGRRLTLFLSFFIGSLLTAFVPWTSPYVFPWLILIRIFIQLCFCAPNSSPLVADYIHSTHVGKGVAMIGVGIVLGEVFSMGVLFRITATMSPEMSFALCAAVGLVFSFFFLFVVKEPQIHTKT